MTGSPGAESGIAVRRVAVLDGLRGIAILLVLARHFFRPGEASPAAAFVRQLLAGGWFGVDLFFVLSGFLITGILYDAKSSPVYFRSFYARRFLRIFPLYYATLLAIGVVIPLVLRRVPDLSEDLVRHWPWYWTYTVNIGQALGRVPITGFWEHTWSLAVEEQFYLVWPLVVWRLERRALMRVALACLAVAVLARIGWLATGHQGEPLYVFTLTRMDGLAVGAWLALAARGDGGLAALRRPAMAAGGIAAAIMAGLFLLPERFGLVSDPMQLVGYPTLAVGFGALLVLAVTAPAGAPLARALGARWLRFFGSYSYAIYLLHFLVIGVLRMAGWWRPQGTIMPSLIYGVTATAITAAIAWTSWQVFEGPILRLKDRFPYR